MKKLVFGLCTLFVAQVIASERPLLHWTFDAPNEFGAFEYDASGLSNDGVVVWDRIGGRGGMQWAPGKGIYRGAAWNEPS